MRKYEAKDCYHKEYSKDGVVMHEISDEALEGIKLESYYKGLDESGYNDTTAEQKEKIKEARLLESNLLKFMDSLAFVDKRSLAWAKTNVQTGIMWLVRAICNK